MKVSKKNLMTPDEEYDYVTEKLSKLGNYFSWDVHPNVIRNTALQRAKLRKRLHEIVDSEEFRYYTNWYT